MRGFATAFLVCAISITPAISKAQTAKPTDPPSVDAHQAPLTVDQIVKRLEERNREREAALRKFEGTRVYSVKYTGFFGKHEAAMTVDVSYVSPNTKQFTIVSESGSKFIVDHVLKGLLEGEKEAADPENKQRTALTTDNYEFKLERVDGTPNAPEYELDVKPRKDYKYLYRGKIWVDGKDFAVTRIEAEPAKSPSFWVKRSEVSHRYEKVDAFWLPAENKTDSWIRLGGRAMLSIEYQNYKITEADPIESAETNTKAGKPIL